jgi:ABC-type multidrug transport system fused ATPase/permease subunit
MTWTEPAAAGADASWWRRLSPFVRPHRNRLAWAVILSVVGTGLIGLMPWVQKIIVDDAVVGHRKPLLPWLALLIALAVAGFVLNYLRRSFGARASLDVQDELRRAIHRKVNDLDMVRHGEISIGDAMSRAAGDVTLVQAFLNQIPIFTANLTMLGVALVVMAGLSAPLCLVVAGFVPIFLVLAVRFRDRIFPASWNDQRLTAAVAGVVDEAVSGVRVVKAFAQEDRELSLLALRSRALYASRMRTVRLTARYSSTLQALPTLAQFGVLWLGGWLAIEGRVSLGTFLAFSSYLVQLVTPVRMLSGMLAASQQARTGAERVLEMLEWQPVVQDRPGAVALDGPPGAIRLDHVSFGHGSGPPVVDDVSIEIAPGERLGIVGASGSGKTTLALLLARFYDPTAGTVRFGGRDIRDFTAQSIRRSVGFVFEESYLFSGTIHENIALGAPDATAATDAAVEQAARTAEAHDFIAALPGGYATRVGEHGYSLSGGQRQRIALARAVLANPAVLVLDDATSAIDARTEEAIHRGFERTLGERTTILVAHRQSTLRLAHRILVVDRGRVVAEGTNEALLATCPLYRDLLAGPDAEPDEAADDKPGVVEARTLDPHAWPKSAASNGAERAASVDTAIDLVTSTVASAHGGGGGVRDLGGHRAALVAATPELLAKVAALPPATDAPSIDPRDASIESSRVTWADLLRPFRGAVALGIALVGVDAATTLAGPFVTGRAIDLGIIGRAPGALFGLAALFLGLQIVSWINAQVMQVTTGTTSENLLFLLRVRSFAHLQRVSLDFYDRETSGRIMTRMTTDVEAFALLVQQGLLTAVVSILTCGGVLFALVALEPRLSVVVLASVPFLILATVAFFRRSTKAYLAARERVSAVHSYMQESLTGFRVTQAYAAEARSHARFAAFSRSYRDARLRSMELIAVYFPFLQLVSTLMKAAVLGLAAGLVHRGLLTPGVLLAFLLYLDQFFTPLQQLSVVFDQWIQARVSLGRLRELFATRSTTPESTAPVVLSTLRGDVRFEGVRFAYEGGAEALRGVDLHVRPGETVALVGTTGAGKSTFVKLVARFYDATRGCVRIDGVPIADLAIRPYRTRIGYVPQEAFLFSGTLRSNIAYGRPDASDEEVERAARSVGAHRFIAALREGYYTPVSERGRSLSAGERQLLCLARAALIDPALLILDEATSNLDLATEARVRYAMRKLARGRTTLLIAHRLQTARNADRIVLLEDGQIIEEGSHRELVARRGAYAKLWEAFAASRPAPVRESPVLPAAVA